MKAVSEREGRTEDLAKTRKMYLDDKIAKYGLNPVAVGFFGGVLDFNKMGFFIRRTFGFIRPQLEKDGFKEMPPGVYDLRDWEEIRVWAKELATKARQ
jgi:menaquinone-dependent protoporphyrinogen IX oxidase